MDKVTKKTRSLMMSGIRNKGTQPELLVRSLLDSKGIEYAVNVESLPGTPDIVLEKYQAIIQVHGCFWHKHECNLFKLPTTRAAFWKQKLELNRIRDQRDLSRMHTIGWKTLIVWECAVKGASKLSHQELTATILAWLINDPSNAEIIGRQHTL